MALEFFFLLFLRPSTSSRAHFCGSRYRLSLSLNLFASTYHELEDNHLAALYLRLVHILRVCSYLARSSCGILAPTLRRAYIFVYSLLSCPAGISEGFVTITTCLANMHVCAYFLRVSPAELAMQNVVDFFLSTYQVSRIRGHNF